MIVKRKILPLEKIKNRMVTFEEDLPDPTHIMFGCPVYHILVNVDGRPYLLQTYGRKRLMNDLATAEPLEGKKALIQLPEQQGAEWGAMVF